VEANRYQYAGQDPINLIDPLGLHSCPATIEGNIANCEGTGWGGFEEVTISDELVGGVVSSATLLAGCTRLYPAIIVGAIGCGASAFLHGAGLRDDVGDEDDEFYWFE
jgi:hypothetical protein